ncbi:hypothetical protein ACHQM5_029289 [Ranunculus cassubicifolius]
MKLVLPAILLICFLLSSSFLQSILAGSNCAKAGVSDRCIKYRGVCCKECKCVPSGTYDNKHECPCHRDKLNSKGSPKCP